MRFSLLVQLAVTGTAAAAGTGPYSASWTQDPTAPNHVIYAPSEPPAGLRLPVIIWGQGACSFNATTFDAFLKEVASHGVFILSNGTPDGPANPDGMAETSYPNPVLHYEALDWVTAHAGKGKYSHVDSSRLAAAGMSCGGIQAYAVQHDPRVTAIGIFNSGIKNQTEEAMSLADRITKPIFYFIGGPDDVAYPNAERDYTRLPKTTPKWKGNLPVGHGGDYHLENGGQFAVAASNWAKWVLRGDWRASEYFTGSAPESAKRTGWDVVFESLHDLKLENWDEE
ncbi:Alpha/Beta hydrolase protein [Podospora aff. communis PSN243]|uniref:Alpha/Beta hydrolase protein n=1 Tax=Podospora aff. communis PSN243 TaxID=3040156 RepID=A0AAV9G0G8_9PEZI|nr:Alpha/Beta hydrolase protein [Podospora aff. communis PSN243]